MLRALRILPLVVFIAAAQAQDPAATARKALDAVLAGRYAEFLQGSTSDVQKDLPEPSLAKIADTLKAHGAVQSVEQAQVTKNGPNTAVVIPVKFTNRSVNFRFIINSS